ncbi:hypothetical protein BDW71DRAFT_42759 [Aspergillus fruticulosus]
MALQHRFGCRDWPVSRSIVTHEYGSDPGRIDDCLAWSLGDLAEATVGSRLRQHCASAIFMHLMKGNWRFSRFFPSANSLFCFFTWSRVDIALSALLPSPYCSTLIPCTWSFTFPFLSSRAINSSDSETPDRAPYFSPLGPSFSLGFSVSFLQSSPLLA